MNKLENPATPQFSVYQWEQIIHIWEEGMNAFKTVQAMEDKVKAISTKVNIFAGLRL